MNHVFVVEHLDRRRWRPTAGVGLTAKDATNALRQRWMCEPAPKDGSLRIVKYVREGK